MKVRGTPKTGGRAKGTPNKVTTDLREWIAELLNKNKMLIAKDIKRLEPQQRVMIFEKLLNYAVPKMQSVQSKIDINRLTDEQLDTIIVELSNQIRDEADEADEADEH